MTEARCEYCLPGPDLLLRERYRCEFRDGHKGLHYAAHFERPDAVGRLPAEEPWRWGTEAQFREELFLGCSVTVLAKGGAGGTTRVAI